MFKFTLVSILLGLLASTSSHAAVRSHGANLIAADPLPFARLIK